MLDCVSALTVLFLTEVSSFFNPPIPLLSPRVSALLRTVQSSSPLIWANVYDAPSDFLS